MKKLTAAQSNKRIAELRKMGCKVKTVETPRGTLVYKKCPPDSQENPVLNWWTSSDGRYAEANRSGSSKYVIQRTAWDREDGPKPAGWSPHFFELTIVGGAGGYLGRFKTMNAAKAEAQRQSVENPLSKDANTLITIGAMAAGFGLLLVMVKMMGSKKPDAPTPPPAPVKPVSYTTEPSYKVYQRYIENLDQQNMKCAPATFVFEGPRSRANELAWQLTSREPVGGKGTVAVSVPSNFAISNDCNWRRVCYADGSCMGVVGLA